MAGTPFAVRPLLHTLLAVATVASGASAQLELQAVAPIEPPDPIWFGYSAAIAGDIAAFGAPQADGLASAAGAAFVFEPDASDTWTQTADLVVVDGAPQDLFGYAVAVHAGTVVVGAPLHAIGPVRSGAAYVFEKTPVGWALITKLVPQGALGGEQFGSAVAILDGTIVVGAPLASASVPAQLSTGAAYVYRRLGGQWTFTQKVAASDAAPFRGFGSSVGLQGDQAIVGSPLTGLGGNAAEAAYVFRTSGPTWVQDAILTAPDGAPGDRFGQAVDVFAGTAFVGAPRRAVGDADRGAVYVFGDGGSSWSLNQLIEPDPAGPTLEFGSDLDALNGRLAIGAPLDGADGPQSGAAWMYVHTPVGWVEAGRVAPSAPQPATFFGGAIALSTERLVAGSFASSDIAPAHGKGWVFDSTSTSFVAAPATLSVSSGGVQHLQLDAGPSFAGLSYLVLGSATGTSPGPLFDGLEVPLVPDAYWNLSILAPNAPPLAGTLGTLDPLGRGLAGWAIPGGVAPQLAGKTLHHAYVVIELLPTLLQIVHASNAAPLTFTP